MNSVMQALGFGLVTSAILAFGAAGFTLQYGITGIFNLAYGDVMTAAMYAAYVVNVDVGVSIWVALAVGVVVGAVISFLLSSCLYAPMRRRGVPLWSITVATFAVASILQNVILAAAGGGFKTYKYSTYSTVHILGMVLSSLQIIIIFAALAAMSALHVILKYTRLGKQMRATAANAELARTSGIATGRATATAALLSGGLCGAAGVLAALNLTTFSPTTGETLLLVVVAAAVFGGVGQPYGAMLGALVIGISTELAALVSPNLKDVVAFTILAAMLLVRPSGLIPAPAVAMGSA